MVNPNRFYTYAYLRVDRTPYYIGKGKGNRAYNKHQKGISVPKNKSRIIFLKQNLTEEEAFKHEIYMIAVFGRKDLGAGILRNRSYGGDGSSGAVRSEEWRRSISEKMSKNGKGGGSIGGKKAKELGLGIHALTTEQRIEIGKKSSETNKKNGTGVYGMTFEQRRENGKKVKELGVGIFAMTTDELIEAGKKGNKITNSQRWECLETGFITNPGNLTKYQKARDIDTSKRKRIS
jgi:hypothetical protein